MPTRLIQCPNSIPCLGVDGDDGDFPVRNLSAELPDIPLFYCTAFGGPTPQLGVPCGAYQFVAVAASVVSQGDACELANLILQGNGCPPVDGGNIIINDRCDNVLCGGPTVCKNGVCVPIDQSCPNTPCPAGEECIEGECLPIPPPNDFGPIGTNPRRPTSPVLLGDLNPAKCCADTEYTGTITARGFSPFLWTATGLPAGLKLVPAADTLSAQITGNPSGSGTQSFTVQVQAADGGVATKLFTLAVVDITTATPLPEGQALQSYSQTLAQAGGTPPISWQISSGSLPPGLSLDESTGIISGTPPALVGGQPNDGGTYTFTVFMQDEAT